VVVFLEQGIVFDRPLLELHVDAAAVDADDAPDATGEEEKEQQSEDIWDITAALLPLDQGSGTFLTGRAIKAKYF